MRVFKTKQFAKFAKSAKLTDAALTAAAAEVQSGLVEAKLGGNLFKKRVAIGSKGKSGGLRTILVHKKSAGQVFFLYGFAKNEKDNITTKELAALKLLDKTYSDMTDKQIGTAVEATELLEVTEDGSKKRDSESKQNHETE